MFKKVIFSNYNLARVIPKDCQRTPFQNALYFTSLLSSKQSLRYAAFSSLQSVSSTLGNSNYLMTLAQCYFRQENYTKALEKLNALNAEDSTDVKQLKLLAKTQIAMSSYEEGLKTFQKIVEILPGDIESNVFQMGILEKISDAPDVEIDIINERILANHQEDEGQQVALALVSLLDEEYNVIPDILNNISEFQSEENRFLAYAVLKESFLRLNKYKEGMIVLQEAANNCKSFHEDIYFELGKLAHLSGDQEKELDSLEKTLAVNQYQFDVLVELGWIYFTKGESEKSQQYLARAESIEKDNSKTYFYQAKILQAQNELDGADKLLQKCIELDGKGVSAQVYNQLGVLFLQKRNYKQAQKYFFDALEINNEEAQYYFNIALTFNLTKDIDRAISYYEKGLILKPQSVSALRSKGILLAKQKKYLDAIDTLNLGLKIEPENTDVLFELANVYDLTHNKLKAVELCNTILSIHPNHKPAADYIRALL